MRQIVCWSWLPHPCGLCNSLVFLSANLATSSYLLLVVRPGASSSFLFPIAMPGAPSSFLFLVACFSLKNLQMCFACESALAVKYFNKNHTKISTQFNSLTQKPVHGSPLHFAVLTASTLAQQSIWGQPARIRGSQFLRQRVSSTVCSVPFENSPILHKQFLFVHSVKGK